jgi:hypothetical protein
VTSRSAYFTAGLALILAAASAMLAPIRPALTSLPADWSDPPLPPVRITIHPGNGLLEGDGLGVDASVDTDPGKRILQLRMNSPAAFPVAETAFLFDHASKTWGMQLPRVWDSSGYAGWNTLFVGIAARKGAPVAAATSLQQIPIPVRAGGRPDAAWRAMSSACCDYYFLSGTESERDIAGLIAQTERIHAELFQGMGGDPPTLGLVFLPRLYGQGGLAMGEAVLSHMDRNYSGTDFVVVQEHEMVHVYANSLITEYPPLILQEGWAVYLTGGHYRAGEPLQARAAAVVGMDQYIPLADLADSFYSAQHETAYIEAGAFVEYLAGTYGRERVFAMFRDPDRGELPSAELDSMLRRHFDLTLAEGEAAWLRSLRGIDPDPEQIRDVEFTLQRFETLRAFQRLFDPGGFQFDLWLPDLPTARAAGITADYLPGSDGDESIALQLMLLAAQRAAADGEWDRAEETLTAVDRVLDAVERRAPDPCFLSPIAQSFRTLVSAVVRQNGDPLNIEMHEGWATVEFRDPVTLQKGAQEWRFVNGNWVPSG